MRVDQFFINPITGRLGQFADVYFTCGHHHLSDAAVNGITIYVDVREVVVSPDRLYLLQRILQGVPIPEPNVVERRSIRI